VAELKFLQIGTANSVLILLIQNLALTLGFGVAR